MRLEGVGLGESKSYRNRSTGFEVSLEGDGQVDSAVAQAYLSRKPEESFVSSLQDSRVQALIQDCLRLAAAHQDKAGRTDDAKYQELGQTKQEFADSTLRRLPGWGHSLVGYDTADPREWKVSADTYVEGEGSAHQFITVDTGKRAEVWLRTNTGEAVGQPGYVHWLSANYDPATGGIVRETLVESLTAQPARPV